MKKKILFIERSSLTGGSYESLKGIVEGLDPARYGCHLVSLHNLPDPEGGKLFASQTLLRRGSPRFSRWRASLKYRLQPFASNMGWPHAILEREAVKAFRKVLETLRPDLIYGNVDPLNEAVFFREAVRLGVPIFSHIRTTPPRKTRGIVTRFINSSVTQFISNSAFTKNLWVDWGLRDERHEIIYNGVRWKGGDLVRRGVGEPRSADGKLRFVCCGRLVSWKRWNVVLEALALLAKGDRKLVFECSFLGEGPEMSRLKDLAAALGLEKIVHFLGHQPEAVQMLPDFDCLLHTASQEPFGRVIVEAMHTGVIVVGCNSGGVVEIIDDGETGYLAHGETAEDFVQAISRCLAEKTRWPNLLTAARAKAVEEFAIENQVQRIVSQIDRVCQEQRPLKKDVLI